MEMIWEEQAAACRCSVCHFNGEGKKIGHTQEVQLVRCPQCGSIALEGNKLDGDYTTIAIDQYVAWTAGLSALSAGLRLFENHSIASMLDVGCNYGFLPDMARTLYGCEVLGLEPSDAGQRGARELGVPIIQGYLDEKLVLDKKYDLVTMFEVLEYVPDPGQLIAAAAKVVSDKGIMLLTTPLAECIGPDLDSGLLVALVSPGLHHVLLTASGLRGLIAQAGFTNIHITQGKESLVAMASLSSEPKLTAQLEPLPPDAMIPYYQSLAKRAAPRSALLFGALVRQLLALCYLGRYAEMCPVADALADTLRETFSVEIASPKNVSPTDMRHMAPLLIRVGYALGIKALLYDMAPLLAGDYFSMAAKTWQHLDMSSIPLDPEEIMLKKAVLQANLHAASPHGAVSVVMPVYNGSRTILEAVESIQRQTEKPRELIIIDDGSTDNGIELVRRVQADFPIRIFSKTNGGQSAARNAGIQEATSEYIAMIDQDDRWLPEHIRLLKKSFKNDKAIGWVFSDFSIMDSDGRVLDQHYLRGHGIKEAKSTLEQLLAADIMALPSASIIRRQAILDVGGFDSRLVGYEDDDLYIRIFQAGYTQVFLREATACHRISATSASRSMGFQKSRLIFLDKLLLSIPDDHHYFNKYYSQDCVIPRFIKRTAAEYLQCIALGDLDNASFLADTLREIVKRRGFKTRRESLIYRLALELIARPKQFKRWQTPLSLVSRVLLPTTAKLPTSKVFSAVRARTWYVPPQKPPLDM